MVLESPAQPVWYFAYGSNLDGERFRSRVGAWRERRPATLAGYRLRFSDDVRSEGGGGAIIQESPDGVVHGALYLISAEQLAAMDATEFEPGRDTGRRAVRIAVTVSSEDGPVEAQAYTIRRPGRGRRPSAAYLGHILRGLEELGFPEAILESVRETAESEE